MVWSPLITDLPHSQVHGPGGKEREGMNLDHDGNKRCVKEHLDKTWSTRKKGYLSENNDKIEKTLLPEV